MPVHGAVDERKRQRSGNETGRGGGIAEHSSHPVCGAEHTNIGDHNQKNCTTPTWKAWNGTDAITYDENTNTAYVYLTANVARTSPLTVSNGQTLYLCLNGHSITKTTRDSSNKTEGVIKVNDNAKFILSNCKEGGTITHASDQSGNKLIGRGVMVTTGTLIMYGGEISGNVMDWDGGGAYVNGSFIMYGGTIKGNKAEANGGGGVCVSGNKFAMYGGEISGNETSAGLTSSNNSGGGALINTTSITMNGGIICGNQASGTGGGVHIANYVAELSGITITNNTCGTDKNGGGVSLYNCTIKLSGAVNISGNVSGGTISNGSLSGGTANNIYLPTGKTITISSELTSTTPIGVTTQTIPTESSYVEIARSSNSNWANPSKFTYENDHTISISVKKGGSMSYLRACNHSWKSIWEIGDSEHWHQCKYCDTIDNTTKAAHSFEQALTERKYQKSPATCTSPATYFKSCVCGKNGTETFESGEKDASKHTGFLGGWQSDDKNHWKAYSCCNAHAETAAHTPGAAATEEAPQTCTTCGYELAPALGHTHIWASAWQGNDTHHWHACTKSNCTITDNSQKDGYAAHSGGTATCQSKAVCDTCKQPYGEKDMTNHVGGTEVRNSKEATTSAEGYTGDTYCLGCNTVIQQGTTIPKKTTSGGSGYTPSPSPGKNDSNQSASTSVTVPVSGEDKSVQIDAAVSGTTATIENVYTSKLDTVIGNDVKVGTVTIDFSGLNKEVNAAKLPADVVARIAAAANDPNNDTENLKIVFTDNTSIVLDAKALGAKSAQGTAADLTISIKNTTNSSLNTKQQKAVGSRPALDINLTSAGKQISDMGGEITISAPYRLHTGEKARGIVVYYVNEQGKKMRCETSYDPAAKQVSWKTDHLSVYMIGYDKSKVTPAKKPTTGKNTTAAVTYTVKRGDTLHAIARKYNTRVSKIVAANSKRIKNPNLIYSGWKLKIPQNQRKS